MKRFNSGGHGAKEVPDNSTRCKKLRVPTFSNLVLPAHLQDVLTTREKDAWIKMYYAN